MAFNQLLHPEIILNLRGDKTTREMYQKCLSQIEIFPGALEISPELMSINQRDPHFIKHLAVCKKFVSEKGVKTYHVAKDFLKALAGINRDFPLENLPERFFGYISFAPETVYDEETWVQGAYVFIGSIKETALPQEDQDRKVAWISYLNKPFGPGYGDSSPATNLLVHLDDTADVFKLIKSVPQKDSPLYPYFVQHAADLKEDDLLKSRAAVFRAIFNTVLYIHAQDSELEKSFPASKTHFSNSEIKKRGIITNDCMIPITFVHRGYHERHFSVDSTFVQSHPRWQRCGPEFSNIKLIWVKEHERHFSAG